VVGWLAELEDAELLLFLFGLAKSIGAAVIALVLWFVSKCRTRATSSTNQPPHCGHIAGGDDIEEDSSAVDKLSLGIVTELEALLLLPLFGAVGPFPRPSL
jgi:hypothetical protein